MEFNLEETNPTISRVKVKIAYDGKNRKKFDISKKVFDDMVNTLKGTPIVAFYSEKAKDIGGHEGDIFKSDKGLLRTGKPVPYGFVDPVNEPWWEEQELEDGRKKNFLFAYAYLWKMRYPKEVELIEKSGQSMEIKLEEAMMVDGYITPTKAKFVALCALGNEVTETFEGAGFEKFSTEEFSRNYEDMKTSIFEAIGFSDDNIKEEVKESFAMDDNKEESIVENKETKDDEEKKSMKGDVSLMENGMMKDMYSEYGMDRYMFVKMGENMVYAIDMEEMKPVSMGCGMKEGMAIPDMDSVAETQDFMMEGEDVIRALKAMHDMYMAKLHGYMSLETEKTEAVELSETFKASIEEKDKEIVKLTEDVSEFALLKKRIEAKEILNHEDFSILTEDDKTALVEKINVEMEMETFKLHAESFSFQKMKDAPKVEDKDDKEDTKFSMDLVVDKKAEEKPKDLYEEIKANYKF